MLLLILLYVLMLRAFYRLAPESSNRGGRLAVSAWVVFAVWQYIPELMFFDAIELYEPGSFRKIPAYITRTAPFLIGLLVTWIYYDHLKQALRSGKQPYWIM